MNYYKRVQVKFNLPFAVDVPNGRYTVRLSNFVCGVNVQLKQSKENSSGLQGGARFVDDRFGHTNYSEILVDFMSNKKRPYLVGAEEDMFENYSLEAVNRFLDNIRWTTDDYTNHHIIRKDVPSMNCDFFDENNVVLKGNYFSMKSEMKVGGTSRTPEEIELLKTRLETNQKIPFEIELVRNAKDHLKFENYRMVSIEIQNAVEYLMSKIMTKYLRDVENKTDDEIDEILKNFQQFRPTLRKATFDTITGSKEFQEWDIKCARLRHSVLHRGKQPNQNEANEALDSGLAFLNILKNYK